MSYQFSKPTYGVHMPANPFGVVFHVSNTTNPTEGQGSPGPSAQGRTPKNPFTTLAAAVNEAVSGRGDTIILQRGTYTENVNINKAGLTIRAANQFGYPDHVVIQGYTQVSANSVTLMGMEFFSNDSSAGARGSVDVGLTSGTTFVEVSGFAAIGCSFASDGTTEPRYGLKLYGGNNHVVQACRFVDQTFGLVLRGGSDSIPTGCRILDNEFLENTTVDLGTGGAAGELGLNMGVGNIIIRGNVFGRGAVQPTTYVTITGASSGIMCDNYFAHATNAIGNIVIPAGILYVANKTEAGVTTARPA